MQRKGLILIHTGNGKGKTTAAFGAAFRAAGHGMNVLILQFMKGRKDLGELKALRSINLPIELKQFGRGVFFKSRACEPIDIYLAYQGLWAFREAIESRVFDLIILDEIITAINFHILNLTAVKNAITLKYPELHLILTGGNAPQALLEMADLVTEMHPIKHHYDRGIQAQKGIEY